MNLVKAMGLVALVLSAPIANAKTYEVTVNQYGGTSTTLIDQNSYEYASHCNTDSVFIQYGCADRYVYNYELYESRALADKAARDHLAALEAAYTNSNNYLPLYKKIDAFIETYSEITESTLEAVWDYHELNKAKRFEEFKNITSWIIIDEDYPIYGRQFEGTYKEFLNEVAYQQTKNISKIRFQTNPAAKQARIQLIETIDGQDYYFNEDWVYVSTENNEYFASDLIVGLAEEAFQEGYATGWYDGFSEGYDQGYIDGYIDGYNAGVLSTE